MVKWSKICGVLILSLMLGTMGGCRKDTSTVSEVVEEIKTTEVSDTKDDKLDMDDVILQVGDSAVSYREVLFYVYQAKRNYEDELGPQVWDVALKGGDSFESYAKEELLRQLTEMHIICEQAKKEQITLSDSENAEAENKADQLLADATSEEIEKYGFLKESLEDIFKENAIAKKMYEKVILSEEPNIDEATVEKSKSELFEDAYTEWSKQYSAEVSVKLWKKIGIKED